MVSSFKLHVTGLILLLALVSCSKDDDNNPEQPEVKVTTGLYIINEGNYYSQIDGSLSYLDFTTSSIGNGLFKAKNGRSLGGTPNSGVLCNGKLYISTTDDNRVEVLDAKTLIAGTPISITSPRAMTACDGYVFVTSYTGKVSKIDTSTDQIIATSETIGSCLEGIASANGYIYVCNAYNSDYTYNSNIVKLTTNLKKVKDIQVVCNPNTIETDGSNLYVVSYGNYTDVKETIQKIDTQDNVTTLCNGVMASYNDNKLYVVAQTYDENWKSVNTYFVYDLQTGKTSTFNDGKEIEYPCSIVVNPSNGNVFISAYHLSEYGYGDYSNPGYIVEFDATGKMIEKYNIGSGPTHFALIMN